MLEQPASMQLQVKIGDALYRNRHVRLVLRYPISAVASAGTWLGNRYGGSGNRDKGNPVIGC